MFLIEYFGYDWSVYQSDSYSNEKDSIGMYEFVWDQFGELWIRKLGKFTGDEDLEFDIEWK